MATPGHKGLYVSWQSGSQQIAIMFAAFMGYALNRSLSATEISEWGWRIPFFIGCLIVPFVFVIRRSLQETEEFLARIHRPSAPEMFRSMVENWRIVVAGALLVAMTTVSFYLITVYTPTFGKSVLNLDDRSNLTVAFCVGLSNFFWLPVMGAASDRIGRLPVLLTFTILTILTAYPALSWLVTEPSFGRMLGVDLWPSFLYGGYNGAMVVTLTEVMPRDARTLGFSLAYSLATALGGFTPAISTLLIQVTGNKASPGLWMSFAALCGLTAAWHLFRAKATTKIVMDQDRIK